MTEIGPKHMLKTVLLRVSLITPCPAVTTNGGQFSAAELNLRMELKSNQGKLILVAKETCF